jgi:hypothetical protein
MEKQHKVVMLAAEKATDALGLIKCIKDRASMFPEDSCKVGQLNFGVNWSSGVMEFWQKQHLYIISGDEIKEGDWCINTNENILCKCVNTNDKGLFEHTIGRGHQIHITYCKKIIATTDKSLGFKEATEDYEVGSSGFIKIQQNGALPQIPESFIQAYIKAYNEEKPITEVAQTKLI